MYRWPLTLLAATVLAALVAFSGALPRWAGVGEVLFFVFGLLFLISVFSGRKPPRGG